MSAATTLDSSLIERRSRRLSQLFRYNEDGVPTCEETNAMEVSVATKKKGRKRRLSSFFTTNGATVNPISSDYNEESHVTVTNEETETTNECNLDPCADTVDNSPSPIEEGGEVELTKPRRSLRKKIRMNYTELQDSVDPVVTRSVKLHQNSSLKDIQNYYLDKRVKKVNPSLETIFEEPQVVNNEDVVMSSRKFKRLINFSDVTAKTNAAKVRKRKAKAKTVKNMNKVKKVSMKFLMDKLDEIEQD